MPQAFKREHEQLSIMCDPENPFEKGSKFISLNFGTAVRNPYRFQVYAKNRLNSVSPCYSSLQTILPFCLLSEYVTAYRPPWRRVLGKLNISRSFIKFLSFYGTRNLITKSTTPCNWSPSLYSQDTFQYYHRLLNDLFPSGFPVEEIHSFLIVTIHTIPQHPWLIIFCRN